MDEQVRAELGADANGELLTPVRACVRILHELAALASLLDRYDSRGSREDIVRLCMPILKGAVAGVRYLERDREQGERALLVAQIEEVAEYAASHQPENELGAGDIAYIIRAVGGVISGVADDPPDPEAASLVSEGMRSALLEVAARSANIIERARREPGSTEV